MYWKLRLGVLTLLVISIVSSIVVVGGQRVFAAHVRCNAGGSDRRTQSMNDAVRLTAVANASAPSITLEWEPHNSSTNFTYGIYRKSRDAKSWGSVITSTGNLQYTDTNVSVGDSYEYRVERTNGSGNLGGCAHQFGYVYSGVNRTAVDQRGKLILLVDNRFTTSLADDLAWLELDLIGDGWRIVRHDVSKDASVSSIKQIVISEYNADPNNVKAVYLFGHVPVPHSGWHGMDGHGARVWPADIYYGDVDGTWTDNGNGGNPGNDGAFDQTNVSASTNGADRAPELLVGRVDFWDMPAFPQGEEALLRNYINKAHDYRNKTTTVRQRGWISDRLGQYQHWETPGIGMWHSMVPLVGRDTYADDTTLPNKTSGIYRSQYHPNPTVNLSTGDAVYGDNGSSSAPNYDAHGFIFADANSTASNSHMDSSGSTNDFRNEDPPVIFNIMFGSYFGDWDTQNNLLRAPLAQDTYGMSNVWSVWGGWQFHHMAMGEPIGYSVVATHHGTANGGGGNGRQYLYNQYYNSTSPEMNLMGDPTLRMHVVAPALNLELNGTQLSWDASLESTIAGYHVYRANSYNGTYTRLTANPITSTSYNDNGASGSDTYMVRVVKLEVSPSGSYYNLSQGVFAGDDLPTDPSDPNDPDDPPTSGQDIPSRLEAELYTGFGGETWTETAQDAGGGQNIAGLDNGDWAEYVIDVPSTGTYRLDLRAATPNSGGAVRARVDNVEVAYITLSNTGGWQNWVTESAEIDLTTRDGQTVRLEFIRDGGGAVLNLNWLEFTQITSAPTAVNIAPSSAQVVATDAPLTVAALLLAVLTGRVFDKRQ